MVDMTALSTWTEFGQELKIIKPGITGYEASMILTNLHPWMAEQKRAFWAGFDGNWEK